MDEITKTLELIKKTNNNHLLFHILHSHLSYVLKTQKHKIFEPPSLFDKILVASCEDPKTRKTNLETKILAYLKSNRKKSGEHVFNLKTILYFLDTRAQAVQNIFILFEVVSYHFNCSDFTDLLIDSILSKNVMSELFGVKGKMMNESAVENVLRGRKMFSHKLLPVYYKFDISPPMIIFEENDANKFKIVESLCFYLKYTKFIDYFKSIAPQTQDFMGFIKDYLNGDDSFFGDERIVFREENIKMETCDELNELMKRMKKLFNSCNDKAVFRSRLIEMIDGFEV